MAGNPVSSATSVTGMPASAMARAVPPLDSSVQPSSCEAAGEVDDAGLVVHGEQRGGHLAEGNELATGSTTAGHHVR